MKTVDALANLDLDALQRDDCSCLRDADSSANSLETRTIGVSSFLKNQSGFRATQDYFKGLCALHDRVYGQALLDANRCVSQSVKCDELVSKSAKKLWSSHGCVGTTLQTQSNTCSYILLILDILFQAELYTFARKPSIGPCISYIPSLLQAELYTYTRKPSIGPCVSCIPILLQAELYTFTRKPSLGPCISYIPIILKAELYTFTRKPSLGPCISYIPVDRAATTRSPQGTSRCGMLTKPARPSAKLCTAGSAR